MKMRLIVILVAVAIGTTLPAFARSGPHVSVSDENILIRRSPAAFDGTWQVTMSARNYDNPNSTMSEADAYHFPMSRRNGGLHRRRGNRGMSVFYEMIG